MVYVALEQDFISHARRLAVDLLRATATAVRNPDRPLAVAVVVQLGEGPVGAGR
jgi:hypothetical protein